MHRLAVLTSASTLLLIFVGGLVTSTGSGLAVPDWPLSYGQLFPPMVGGVLYEHGHRMVAAVVGLLMLALAFWIFARERRKWVGWLAAGALLAVILQGVLGGMTVLFLLPAAVSVAHACLAQAFFCLTVILAIVTGRGWAEMAPRSPEADDAGLRRMAALLAGCIYLQLMLGAVMRHTGAGLAIPDFPMAFGRLIPPIWSSGVAIHFAHRLGAAGIACLAIWIAVRILKRHRAEPLLTRPALLALALTSLQIALGAFTVWSQRQVLSTTAHVACGAVLLATSAVLTLRCYRQAPQGEAALAGGQAPSVGLRAGSVTT